VAISFSGPAGKTDKNRQGFTHAGPFISVPFRLVGLIKKNTNTYKLEFSCMLVTSWY